MAKESERGIVDIETLKKANENLIATMNETLKIQQEGRQKRAQAEAELQKIENEVKEGAPGRTEVEVEKSRLPEYNERSAGKARKTGGRNGEDSAGGGGDYP